MSEPRSDIPSQRPQSLPEGRYGQAGSGSTVMGKVVAAVLGLLVVAILIAGGITLYQFNSTDSITTEVIGVEVIDENSIQLSMTVTRDEPGVAIYCIVRAQDQSKGELGRREVVVPPSESGTVQIDTVIHTSAQAYMGDVYGCGEDVPAYLNG